MKGESLSLNSELPSHPVILEISEALISQMSRYVMAAWAHGSPLLQKVIKSKGRESIRWFTAVAPAMAFWVLENLVVIKTKNRFTLFSGFTGVSKLPLSRPLKVNPRAAGIYRRTHAHSFRVATISKEEMNKLTLLSCSDDSFQSFPRLFPRFPGGPRTVAQFKLNLIGRGRREWGE